MTEFVGTTREKLINGYKRMLAETGKPFFMRTLPYHSVRTLEFEVLNFSSTNAIAYLRAKAQEVEFFNYGLGDAITLANSDRHKATRAETNLSKGGSTNGANDFCIEFLSIHTRGAKIYYATRDHFVYTGATMAEDVANALSGTTPIFDPAAIACPVQVHSPFMLEDALWSAVRPYCSTDLQFDQSGFRPLGGAWLMGQGGASSYLRSNGEPTRDSRLYVEEGYLWARDGEPDSDFLMKLKLESPVVVPINCITQPCSTSVVAPTKIWIELCATVWGFEIGLPGSN